MAWCKETRKWGAGTGTWLRFVVLRLFERKKGVRMKETEMHLLRKGVVACCVVGIAMLMAFAGCARQGAADSALGGGSEQAVSPDAQRAPEAAVSADGGESSVPEGASTDSAADFGDLLITFSNRTMRVSLLDNPTARELYEAAPFTIGFSDFNQTEKIGYPDWALSTQGSPDSCDPEPGDLCLYAPWGNLSLFYEDFRFSQGLVPLGHVIEGAEYLSEIQDGQMLTFEKASE